MKVLYFDCLSGISGDMTLGALVDAGFPAAKLTSLPQMLYLPQVKITVEKVQRTAIAATKVNIFYPEEHVHRHLKDIYEILDKSELNESVKDRAKLIFEKLAGAEAQIHGTEIEQVHFHEVGALDAIMDITGVALAFDFFGIEEARVNTIPVGGGTVKCAHGIMPVPAPATALLLENFTIKFGPVEKELATPTGAAILAALAMPAAGIPDFKILKTGFGAGTLEFDEIPNVLRVFIGESSAADRRDTVWQFDCNLDDMNPEIIPWVIEKLIDAGALDAWATPILMKKGRPGFVLSALSPVDKHDAIRDLIFRETTTIGVRESKVNREKLQRASIEIESEFGPVKFKKIIRPNAEIHLAPEFDECKNIAQSHNLPLREVYARLQKIASEQKT
ncbi:MAG: nickel pincer cofactor biosynthesis protein LarC [Calditrichaeota bacterium]|nr:MAG: nickel pincer cofactor biosynthesis protein LarC [Calditrichota bacterium]